MQEALAGLDPTLAAALQLARDNIETVARAQLGEAREPVGPGQGQRITVAEVAVGAAGIYVPGGRAPYPSTALMGAIPPASPASSGSSSPPRRRGGRARRGRPRGMRDRRCRRGLRAGGAHGIAALALGTETVRRST